MTIQQKLKHELKAVGLVMLYFSCWLAALIALKHLILAEYKIAAGGFSMALIGALILSKVVLILERVPLGTCVRRQPAWMDVVLRTTLYATGVVVLLLEKGFEGRHEHGGFTGALQVIFQNADLPHVWANTICVSAALLFYNIMSAVRRHLGRGSLLRMLTSPLPACALRE